MNKQRQNDELKGKIPEVFCNIPNMLSISRAIGLFRLENASVIEGIAKKSKDFRPSVFHFPIFLNMQDGSAYPAYLGCHMPETEVLFFLEEIPRYPSSIETAAQPLSSMPADFPARYS